MALTSESQPQHRKERQAKGGPRKCGMNQSQDLNHHSPRDMLTHMLRATGGDTESVSERIFL